MRKKRLLILATLALAPAFLSGCGNKETPTYTANFYDWDSTLLSTLTVKQGESAAYTGATPTRVHDEQYSYTFSGWDQSLDNIQKDVLFHAVYAKEAYHGNGNLVLNSATWYLFADTQPATNPENYWHYVNAVPTVWTAA